jgi:hypothetical protein
VTSVLVLQELRDVIGRNGLSNLLIVGFITPRDAPPTRPGSSPTTSKGLGEVKFHGSNPEIPDQQEKNGSGTTVVAMPIG